MVLVEPNQLTSKVCWVVLRDTMFKSFKWYLISRYLKCSWMMWYMMRAHISSKLYRAKHWKPRWSHVTRLRSSSMLRQRIPSLERSDCRIARPQWSEIMGQSLYSEFWSNIFHIVSNLNHLLLLPVTLRQPVSSPRPDACIIASFHALSVQSISCVCLYQRASCLNQGGKAERSCATHHLDIL